MYYSIYGHGRMMINPIYNLNYFLIGMYFGLINYSLQKGLLQKDTKKNNLITFDNIFDSTFSIEDEDKIRQNRLTSYNLAEEEDEENEDTFKIISFKNYHPLIDLNENNKIKKVHKMSLKSTKKNNTLSRISEIENYLYEPKEENDDSMP